MSTILLHTARAITPTTEILDAGILIREGVIEAIGPRADISLPSGASEISASGQTAIPGFIDVHIHGAGGHDVMEGTEQAMAAVANMLARHGTTSFLATTVTASPDDTCRGVEGIARYITQQFGAAQPRAEVLGIHYEGPFISKVRRGVHPAEWVQLPSADLLQRFLHAAAGNARIVTIAPEVLGAVPCIRAARDAGVVVAMGHTPVSPSA
jgi:N-acetylglucosamine-6-phosphate deacetylase